MPEEVVAEAVLTEFAGDAAVAEAIGATAGTAGAAEGAGAALTGVEAVNAAAPGTIAMGLSDGEVAGSVFAPAAAGGATGAVAADTLGGPATTSTGAAAPDSATKSLAQQTVDAGLENYPGEPSGQWGGQTGRPLPGNKGLIDRFLDLKPELQAGIVQGGGLALAGAAGGAGRVLAEQRKAELELANRKALAEWNRSFLQSNTSIGGGGVSVNIRPGLIGQRI